MCLPVPGSRSNERGKSVETMKAFLKPMKRNHLAALLCALSLCSSQLFAADEPAKPKKTPPSVPKSVLDKYDTNKNGQLDPDERAKLKKDRLEKYDTNKDGKLDEAERKAMNEELRKERQADGPKKEKTK